MSASSWPISPPLTPIDIANARWLSPSELRNDDSLLPGLSLKRRQSILTPSYAKHMLLILPKHLLSIVRDV